MNVQAFLDNISFPRTLEELEWFADEFDMEQVLTVAETEWTAPKWAVQGDIVFFYHAKTAIQKISMLETKLKREKVELSEEYYNWLWKVLQRGRNIYKEYGGKIFAIGKVSGRTIYDPQEGDEILHWSSRFYAPIDKIYVLQNPIDISEFSDFIFVSRQSAITPIVGPDFEQLKELIASKNEIPEYLQTSTVIPLPLQKIDDENWLEVTQEYRRLFTLEIQFRRFYVDYFLRIFGDQKKFYAEFECYRDGRRTGFADNAVKIGGKWCFVEVKLNIRAEQHLHNQLKKYCHVEYGKGNKERLLEQKDIWQNIVLVIDTENFYYYDFATDQLILEQELNKIIEERDILDLRNRIVKKLK